MYFIRSLHFLHFSFFYQLISLFFLFFFYQLIYLFSSVNIFFLFHLSVIFFLKNTTFYIMKTHFLHHLSFLHLKISFPFLISLSPSLPIFLNRFSPFKNDFTLTFLRIVMHSLSLHLTQPFVL